MHSPSILVEKVDDGKILNLLIQKVNEKILHLNSHFGKKIKVQRVKDVTRYMGFWLHSLFTHQTAERTVMK